MSESQMANLLDGTLDDLADLPEFKMPPSGVYHLMVKAMNEKTINETLSVEVACIVVEQMEAADPSAEPIVKGFEFAFLFNLGNEVGQGKFKEFLKPFMEKTGTLKLRDTMAASKGLEGIFVLKTTFNKEKERFYTSVASVNLT